ncbi:MAG TPA: hypothetical protein VGQ18_01670 [Gemmatimonadales bacterium]|nr:hypothetical protein [Gemmatimonadales bacterium]
MGIPAAVLWAAIAYFTGMEIGWVAWGVGALVGYAVAKSAHEPSASLGPTAAALAVGSLLLAKILILEFALPPILTAELLKNPDATTGMFVLDMTTHKSFSPELQTLLDQSEARPGSLSEAQQVDMQQKMAGEVIARVSSASRAEKERVARAGADAFLKEAGFFGGLKDLFSLYDALWIFLAVSSAYRIAQSKSS